MSLTIVNGDLLYADETYLCHQCNCVTKRAAHLAWSVFDRYPYADTYEDRIKPSEPGTISLMTTDSDEDRAIVNMYAQYFPGKSNPRNVSLDGYDARLRYFRSCLSYMESLEGSFAFPFGIGCGAAGGDWKRYSPLLERFSMDRAVTLYKLDG